MEVDQMQPLVQMRDTWTFEDLQTLDVEDWHRYEIVDGALLVSPTADWPHELAISQLHDMLLRASPESLVVMSGNLGIRFGPSYRVPDLAVVPRSGPTGRYLVPEDVLLTVEVVSPGSVTSDRLVKPAQYAAAGIENFWRVELDPVSLTAYRLPAEAHVYIEVGSGSAGETAHLDQPFPVEIEVDRLI